MRSISILLLSVAFSQTIIAQPMAGDMNVSVDGISCPSNILMYTDLGLCTASAVNIGTPTATGNFVISSIVSDAPAVFNKALTTVTWTATDGSGNTATCMQTVDVKDNEFPTMVCVGDQQKYTDPGDCSYTVIGNEFDPVSYTDNCGVLEIMNDYNSLNTLSGAVFPKGTTTVMWFVSDIDYYTTACTFVINVYDNEEPVINCLNDQEKNTDPNACTYTVIGSEFDPVFADNCPGAWMVNDFNTQSSLAGVVFPKGSTLVTWTATDSSNNTAICSFEVTVNDNDLPVIGCVLNQVRNTNPSLCTYTAIGNEFDPVSFSDNCSGSIITNDYNGTGTLAGSVFTKGVTTLTWTHTDLSSNTATCIFLITVNDNEAPIITCPGSQVKTIDPGTCAYTVVGNEFNPWFNDNCPGATIVNNFNANSSLAGAVFPKGITTINWTTTDLNSNTAVCSFELTVKSPDILSVSCGGDRSRNTDPGNNNYLVQGSEFDPLAFSYLCPGMQIYNSYNNLTSLNGAIFPVGNTTVTWTILNPNIDTGSCSFVVMVSDNEAPIIGCVDNQERTSYHGVPTYTVVESEFDPATSSDNCPGSVINNDYNGLSTLAGAIFPLDTTIVTWIITDANANTAKCSFVVIVHNGGKKKTIDYPKDILREPVNISSFKAMNPVKADIILENFPNPFTGKTKIKFMLPEDGYVQIDVCDISGRLIQTLFNDYAAKDQEYITEFNGSELSKGIYVYRMTSPNGVLTGKMILAQN